MANNNMFIVYESANRATVEATIKSISGVWAHVAPTVWYISTPFDCPTVRDRVWRGGMQPTDKLIVIDATNNLAGWYSLPTQVSDYLLKNWHR